jgi:L-serine deaminase
MYRTGLDMDEKYRETSHGGLAQIYQENLENS